MTPARKAALQWFYDHGPVMPLDDGGGMEGQGGPRKSFMTRMEKDGDLEIHEGYALTDLGRQRLAGDDV